MTTLMMPPAPTTTSTVPRPASGSAGSRRQEVRRQVADARVHAPDLVARHGLRDAVQAYDALLAGTLSGAEFSAVRDLLTGWS
ncbi:hypothetical protein [Cellulomonas endophytica]|uniref:hypothetical protein n=1 Tax=Cellulomonas endophytica TaxID=2494735 RepID=UPI001012792E|nr:hypothetical protein [Cellulomonas endophytica]